MTATDAFSTADLVDEHGDSALVCDTQFRHFGVHGRFRGRVRTVACFQDNGLVRAVLNRRGEGDVLVVDGGGSLHTALCGDRIAAAAATNGWSGLIVHGAVRDSAALASIGLGIVATGTNPRKSAKDSTGETDVPVEFGGVVFSPGDTVFADEDGVLVVPATNGGKVP